MSAAACGCQYFIHEFIHRLLLMWPNDPPGDALTQRTCSAAPGCCASSAGQPCTRNAALVGPQCVPFDGPEQLVSLEGLGYDRHGTDRARPGIRVPCGSQREDGSRPLLTRAVGRGELRLRVAQLIQQDHVGLPCLCYRQGVSARGRRATLVTGKAEERLDRLTGAFIVLDEQDPARCAAAVAPSRRVVVVLGAW